jgi:hypothetical protein
MLKMVILPRQARDKHREKIKKEMRFSQVSKKNGLSPTYGRKNFTIRASLDSGETWPRSVQLCGLPVDGRCDPATSLAAYSSLVSVPSPTDLGVLWEVETANHLWTGALRFTILPRTL